MKNLQKFNELNIFINFQHFPFSNVRNFRIYFQIFEILEKVVESVKISFKKFLKVY